MIDVSFDSDKRVCTITMSGRISEADQDAAADAFADGAGPAASVRVRGSYPNLRVLLDWQNLEGWEPGAKSRGTIFGLSVRDAVARVAVVAEPKWHGEKDRLEDICNKGEVRFFTPDARDAAREWLTR